MKRRELFQGCCLYGAAGTLSCSIGLEKNLFNQENDSHESDSAHFVAGTPQG